MMAIFLLSSRPQNYLSMNCAGWNGGTPLRTLVNGNIDGRLDSVNLPDDASDAEAKTYICLECSFNAALATMFWLAERSPKGLEGLGVAFDRDWLIGAAAYKDGAFASMTVNGDDLNNLARDIVTEDEDEDDYEDKNEYEQTMEGLIYDQRQSLRDELQDTFIDYFTARVTFDGLDQVEPFKTLNHKGGTATLNILDDVIPQIKDRLSQKVDYYSFESMATLMKEQADEFWKDHRSRVREIMNSMPDELRGNKEFFRAVIPGVASWLLEYANETVRADKEIIRLARRADKDNNWSSTPLEYASDSLKADREVVLEAVKAAGYALEYADDSLKADREVVLEAVKAAGYALEYASDSLKADREVVLAAVKEDGGALKYADDSLKADREVVLEAVKAAGYALEYADDSLKADREVVLEAFKSGGGALRHADDGLKADREVVLAAVKEAGYALEYADDSLKADREVVLEAVKQYGPALKYADDSLKADREVVLEAVKQYGPALEYADDGLKADLEFVLEAVKQDGRALEYADDGLKTDREVVLEAVKQYCYALTYAADSLKADREFILETVKEDGRALQYASEELQQDEELQKIAKGADETDSIIINTIATLKSQIKEMEESEIDENIKKQLIPKFREQLDKLTKVVEELQSAKNIAISRRAVYLGNRH